MPVSIVCCLDQRYVLALCVLLESLGRNSPEAARDVEVLVLHEALPDAALDRFVAHSRRLGIRLECVRVDPLDERYPSTVGGPHGDQLTRSIYLRLLIGDVLPPTGRALYLDSDVLVRGDIRPLLEQPMSGFALGAVQDPIQPTLDHGYALPGWREEGVPGSREYFNSGVLLLDLERCRDDDLFGRAKQFLVDFPGRAVCLDQDALNWAADDAWLRLDRRWNTFTVQSYIESTTGPERLADVSAEEARANEVDSVLLHFAGPQKPWLDSAAGNGSPSYVIYREFMGAVLRSEGNEVGEGVR